VKARTTLFNFLAPVGIANAYDSPFLAASYDADSAIAGNQPFQTYPRVLGHELAGKGVETDSASPLEIGQVVTINSYLPCGRCLACDTAKPNCCVNIRVLGAQIDGGMTEFVCVAESAVILVGSLSADGRIPGHRHARRPPRPDKGRGRVLVTGAGPTGFATALFARASGGNVSLIDTAAGRVAHARDALGFDQVHILDQGVEAWLQARSEGEGFDAIFDATGSAEAIEKGFAYVAHRGRYVLVSVVKDQISFSDPEFHKREMQLISSRNATRHDFQLVIDMMVAGAIPVRALQTDAFELTDLASVVPDLMARRGEVLKAIGRF